MEFQERNCFFCKKVSKCKIENITCSEFESWTKSTLHLSTEELIKLDNWISGWKSYHNYCYPLELILKTLSKEKQ